MEQKLNYIKNIKMKILKIHVERLAASTVAHNGLMIFGLTALQNQK